MAEHTRATPTYRRRRPVSKKNQRTMAYLVLAVGAVVLLSALPGAIVWPLAMVGGGLYLRRRDRRRRPLARGERRISAGHWLILGGVILMGITLMEAPWWPVLLLLALWLYYQRNR